MRASAELRNAEDQEEIEVDHPDREEPMQPVDPPEIEQQAVGNHDFVEDPPNFADYNGDTGEEFGSPAPIDPDEDGGNPRQVDRNLAHADLVDIDEEDSDGEGLESTGDRELSEEELGPSDSDDDNEWLAEFRNDPPILPDDMDDEIILSVGRDRE